MRRCQASACLVSSLLVTVALLVSVGCTRPPQVDLPPPDPLAVLVSSGPGDKHTIQVVAAPQLGADGSMTVSGSILGTAAELGAQAAFNPWEARADSLVVWIDSTTLVWNGRAVLDLERGTQTYLDLPKAPVASSYSPADRAVAHLVLQSGQFQVWMTTVDDVRTKMVLAADLQTSIGESSGGISWGRDGSIYFSCPVGRASAILRTDSTGVGPATVLGQASNPCVSPDGLYLAYTSLPEGGDPSTKVVSLAEGQDVCVDLPLGAFVWSLDSKRIALQQLHSVGVYGIPSGQAVAQFETGGRPLLVRFVGDDELAYAEAFLADDVLGSVVIRKVSLLPGP